MEVADKCFKIAGNSFAVNAYFVIFLGTKCLCDSMGLVKKKRGNEIGWERLSRRA